MFLYTGLAGGSDADGVNSQVRTLILSASPNQLAHSRDRRLL